MLTKLATFRGVSPQGEPLVRLFRQGDNITKLAGSMMPEVRDWLGTYKSDKKKVALLINAMGGSEFWGQNVNGDVFPWGPLCHDCRRPGHSKHNVDDFTGRVVPSYGYWTFLDAKPFVHHRNKDPGRAFGDVVVAVINQRMKRIELVAVLDRALASKFDAQDVLDRVDAGEFPDVSMGCRVPYDVCTICGHKSRTRADYCPCIRKYGLGRILEDGRKVGVLNLHPRFFDISFVFIGADRIAKVMVKLGSESDLWVPESVRDGERIYTFDDPASSAEGLVKAASTPGEDLFHAFKPKRELPRVHRRVSKEPLFEGATYGDGVLPTNAAQGTANYHADPFKYAVSEEAALYAARALGLNDKISTQQLAKGMEVEKEHDDGTETDILPGPTKDHKLQHAQIAAAHLKELPDYYTRLQQMEKGAAKTRIEKLHELRPDLLNKHIGPPPKPNRAKHPFVGSAEFQGIKINIEQKVGDVRSGVTQGKPWSQVMMLPYGEIHGVRGNDKDYLDVFLGPDWKSDKVFVVHQNFVGGAKDGTFDEDKVMLGFNDSDSAKRGYLSNYNTDKYFRSITEMPMSTFKNILRNGDMNGVKVAFKVPPNSRPSPTEDPLLLEMGLPQKQKEEGEIAKVASSLSLEDLFAGAAGAVRRERGWKDKTSGNATYHVGSGLGSSFETMQKTAAFVTFDQLEEEAKKAEFRKLAAGYADRIKLAVAVERARAGDQAALLYLVKRAAQKLAVDKEAEIDKEIDPATAVGHVSEILSNGEEKLPKGLLHGLSGTDLERIFSTTAALGIRLRPDEFQRTLLEHIGRDDLADDLDHRGQVFGTSEDEEAPCGPLGSEHVDPKLLQKLLPFLSERSFLGPVVTRRIVRITVVPTRPEKAPKGDSESPLLSKISGAYNWYRREMIKVAAQAPGVVSAYPALHAQVFGLADNDLFSMKLANAPMDTASLAAAAGAVPLALLYSSSLRSDERQGEELGLLSKLIARYPTLSALGAAALVREAMKHPGVHQAVVDASSGVGKAARSIWTGGA